MPYRVTLFMLASASIALLVVFEPTAVGRLKGDALGTAQTSPTGQTRRSTYRTLGQALLAGLLDCGLWRHNGQASKQQGTEYELNVRQKQAEQEA